MADKMAHVTPHSVRLLRTAKTQATEVGGNAEEFCDTLHNLRNEAMRAVPATARNVLKCALDEMPNQRPSGRRLPQPSHGGLIKRSALLF